MKQLCVFIIVLAFIFGCGTRSNETDGGTNDQKQATCPDGYIKKEGLCCLIGLTTICNRRCYPNDCLCVQDTVVCPGEKFCEKGLVCRTVEECKKIANKAYCVPNGGTVCPEGHVCAQSDVCSLFGCCPKERSFICGSECCESQSLCITYRGKKLCIPKGSEVCSDSLYCSPGLTCSPDKKTCLLTNQDYCGNGISCPQGQFCLKNNAARQCCPRVLPQLCGSSCCPKTYECKFGKLCIPKGAELCTSSGTFCPSGWKCGQKFQCIPNTATECGSSWCMPGTVCTSGVCCDTHSNTMCGGKCCPNYFKCASGVCVPPNGTLCSGGIWCAQDSKCSKDGKSCIPLFQEECDQKLCDHGEICAGTAPNRICCLQETPIACGTHCCAVEEECLRTKNGYACVPQGAAACTKEQKPEYCIFGMKCGKLKCLYQYENECPDGHSCQTGLECAKNENEDYVCCKNGEHGCGVNCCNSSEVCLNGRCIDGSVVHSRCSNSSECVAPLKCVRPATNANYFVNVALPTHTKQGYCEHAADWVDKKLMLWTFEGKCHEEASFSLNFGHLPCLAMPEDGRKFCGCLECTLTMPISSRKCIPDPTCMKKCDEHKDILPKAYSILVRTREGFMDPTIRNDRQHVNGFCEVDDLCLDRAYIIDNREGKGGFHGPVGRIKVFFIDMSRGFKNSRFYSEFQYSKNTEIILFGPLNEEGKSEWDDNQSVAYKHTTVLRWKTWNRLHPNSRDRVGILVFESDGCGEAESLPIIGGIAGYGCRKYREDDLLGIVELFKSETMSPGGKRFCLHRDGNPKAPCDGYIWLRTRTR